MSALIVDTSSWIAYFRTTEPSPIDEALREGRVYLPLCSCDFDHWERVGHLRAYLRSSGFEISTPDAHVAQCTLDLQGRLLSEDKIFGKIAARAKLMLQRED